MIISVHLHMSISMAILMDNRIHRWFKKQNKTKKNKKQKQKQGLYIALIVLYVAHYVDHVGLKFTKSACFCLSRAEIKNMCHDAHLRISVFRVFVCLGFFFFFLFNFQFKKQSRTSYMRPLLYPSCDGVKENRL